MSTTPAHPYFPATLALAGRTYVANSWHLFTLIAVFAAGGAALVAATWAGARRLNPRLGPGDLGLVVWFVLCGSIHLFFEGYFVYNHHRMPQMTDFFGQLWKEYALSDSRYMASDPFVLCIESWTAVFWGPLSFLVALLIVLASPYRHPVQALVSTGQFYGDVLYYTTSLFDDLCNGVRHYRPEPYYFWVYFVLMNGAWIVLPLCRWRSAGRAGGGMADRLAIGCLWSSIKATASAFKVQQTLTESQKSA
ncbi:hypothetical protein PZA11_007517 [Diplocarpon coronariae]